MSKKFLVGLVGEGIEHSLTPDLHMQEAKHLGLEYEFRLIDLLEAKFDGLNFSQILDQIKSAGYDAINITFPLKQLAIEHATTESDAVKVLSATNLFLDLQGTIHAENSDWSGFAFALETGLSDAARRKVLQVGTGGAGAATAYALLRWGVQQLLIADLDFKKAIALAEQLRDSFPKQTIRACPIEEAMDFLPAVDGVVQATPIGMYTHPGMPFAIDQLNPSAWVADVIYRPIETEFVQAARAGGHRVLTGSLMAIGQAVDSLRLITGLEPNSERMAEHFEELLADVSVLTRARGI